MSRKKRGRRILGLLLIAAAAGAGGFYYYRTQVNGQESQASGSGPAYKEASVSYGSVIYGITESGTVSFGSNSQTIELPEAAEVSSGSSSSAEASGGTSQASGGVGTGESASLGMENNQTQQTGGNSAVTSVSQTASSTDGGLEIEEVYVTVGQVIQQGDPILKVTDESAQSYRSELEQAVADAELQVEQEEINLESSRTEAQYTYDMNIANGETAQETYDATIASLESTVAKLEEELEEAAEEVAEYEAELEAGSDVEDELEEAQLNYDEIEANLQIAKNNLTTQSIEAKQTYENAMTNYMYAQQLYEIATNGLEDDLEAAQETMEAAQAALEEFDLLMEDETIYAEYGGTVTEIACSAGDIISDGETVMTLTDNENVTMTVMVTQEDISQISIGDAAAVELTAYEGESFDAQVISIDSSTAMGSSAVNYEVTVQLTGDTEKVYSGMTGDVTFPIEAAENVLYVSNRTLHQEGARSYVKVMDEDGTVTEVDVETGFSNGTDVEIVSGLTEGQTVLIESQVSE